MSKSKQSTKPENQEYSIRLGTKDVTGSKLDMIDLGEYRAEMIAEEIGPDQAFVLFYKLELFAKSGKEKLKAASVDTFAGDEKRNILGLKCTTVHLGSYSYNHHPGYVDLVEQKKAIEKKIKALENQMKQVRDGMGTVILVDVDSGEEIPAAKYHIGNVTMKVG